MNNLQTELNPKDLQLLGMLRSNGREKLSTISRETGIPISTVHERLHALGNTVITRHTALLDFAKLGLRCRAKIILTTPDLYRKMIEEQLQNDPNVNSLFKVSGRCTYVLDVVFPSTAGLDAFVEGLERDYGPLSIQTHYIIEELKREGFLADQFFGADQQISGSEGSMPQNPRRIPETLRKFPGKGYVDSDTTAGELGKNIGRRLQNGWATNRR